MADTVKIPGIGPVDKKWIYVGGALIAGIAGYAYWNNARVDDSEISDYRDPDYVHDGGAPEYINPGGSEPPTDEDYLQDPTTNAQWAQLAQELLSDQGYDMIAVGVALGKFFSRMTLSNTQAGMIRAAIAQIGPPPVGAYPVKTSPTPDPDPDPSPDPDPTPAPLSAPRNFRITKVGPYAFDFKWDAVPGAVKYQIFMNNSPINRSVSYDTNASITGLKPSRTYKFRIRTRGKGWSHGPKSSNITGRTMSITQYESSDAFRKAL